MRYVELLVRIQLQSQLAYWIRGDILFGHLCRAFADLVGQEAMNHLAGRYVAGEPWCVVSDARPEGYLPRPCIPPANLYPHSSELPSNDQRKAFKHKVWVPRTVMNLPLNEWGNACVSATEIGARYDVKEFSVAGSRIRSEVHRTTRRLTDKTVESYVEVSRDIPLDITVVVDSSLTSVEQVTECIALVGLEGFGRRHSSGWGQFNVLELFLLPAAPTRIGQSLLTLSPTAPQGLGMNPHRSWYKPFVHAGYLGPAQSPHSGPLAKTPLLLAQTAAVFTPPMGPGWDRPFFGQAIGGQGRLSKRLPGAIHQGFSPYLPVDLSRIPGD